MKKLLLPAFIIMALVQWIIPGSMIYEREEVLRKGKAFRFETEPVDPSDPFKGKYITLNYKERSIILSTTPGFKTGQEVYVVLTVDEKGFALVKNIGSTRPPAGTDYVPANVNYISYEQDSSKHTAYLTYPFEAFYMDEFKAPKAESVYREATIDSSKITYALVKVWKGTTVIENVFIGDKPIAELAAELVDKVD